MRHLLRAAPMLGTRASVTRATVAVGSLHNLPQQRRYSRSTLAQPTIASWLPVPFVTETLAGMTVSLPHDLYRLKQHFHSLIMTWFSRANKGRSILPTCSLGC